MKINNSISLKSLNFWTILNRGNDEGNKTRDIKPLGRGYSFLRYKTRMVNFVIFVVDGVTVLESLDSDKKGYTEMLHQTFMYPFLSIGGRDRNMHTNLMYPFFHMKFPEYRFMFTYTALWMKYMFRFYRILFNPYLTFYRIKDSYAGCWFLY